MEIKITNSDIKQKNKELYYRQVEMLKLFRERNAISQEQYNKSFYDLTVKMGMDKLDEQVKT